LPRSLADLVAQHLVASGRLIEDDPELAYQHAKTARRLAARLGGVREAVAVTAYLSEHYDEALTEFRAVRRMTGNQEVLPTMADCERALGRPEKALALSREKQVKDLEPGSQIEMLIVAAGARRDMGQTAAAIQTLEVPELTKRTRAEWLPRLRYAYADALQEAGRTDEALVWFHRAAGVDGDGVTGAAERAAELEGLQFTDLDDEEDEHGEYVDEPIDEHGEYVDEPIDEHGEYVDEPIVEDALDGQLETEDVVDAPAANEMDLNNEVDEAGVGLESDDQAPADLKPDDEAAASDDETAAGLESDDDVDGKPQD
jgi:tetratricopeptide (TPR) repeat protein